MSQLPDELVPGAASDARRETYFCSVHGFIPVGETFVMQGEDFFYCLPCLRAWAPGHARVRIGLRTAE